MSCSFAGFPLFTSAQRTATEWGAPSSDKVGLREGGMRFPPPFKRLLRTAFYFLCFRILRENNDATSVLQALMTLHGLLAHDMQACAASAMEVR